MCYVLCTDHCLQKATSVQKYGFSQKRITLWRSQLLILRFCQQLLVGFCRRNSSGEKVNTLLSSHCGVDPAGSCSVLYLGGLDVLHKYLFLLHLVQHYR